MVTIDNLHLFVASTIRLEKRNQVGILYLVNAVYALKVFVNKYTPMHEEEAYQLCLSFVRHKEKIQNSKREQEALNKKLLELSTVYPRWKTRKYKTFKNTKIYWKNLYKSRLRNEVARLEIAYQEFEAAFPNYLIQFNELYERVKNVCISERKE